MKIWIDQGYECAYMQLTPDTPGEAALLVRIGALARTFDGRKLATTRIGKDKSFLCEAIILMKKPTSSDGAIHL